MAQPGVDEVADELYAQPPAEFTAARDARAAEARAAGQRELAARIKQLRRPTLSAWAVNLLSRHEAAALAELVELAGELRTAQANLQRDALRELMRRRQQVLAGLVADAGRLAAEAGHPLAEEAGRQVERTLTAALSDPGAAEQVLSGRLVTPLEYAGFGEPLDWSAAAPAAGTAPAPRDGSGPGARTVGRRDAAPATAGDTDRAAGPAAAPAEGTGAGRDGGRAGRAAAGSVTAGRGTAGPAAGTAPRPQPDRRARLAAELATAERDLAEADQEARQALQAQEQAEADRQRAATRREELHRELAQVQEAHAAAEVAIRQAARRATVLERNRSATQRRVERLRTQLADF